MTIIADLVAILAAAEHTLSVHGKIDGDTPLHEQISTVLESVR